MYISYVCTLVSLRRLAATNLCNNFGAEIALAPASAAPPPKVYILGICVIPNICTSVYIYIYIYGWQVCHVGVSGLASARSPFWHILQ